MPIIIGAAFLLCCGVAGLCIARPRKSAPQGFWAGVLLGPLGVAAAFRFDRRMQCYRCRERVNDLAEVCPHCRNPLIS